MSELCSNRSGLIIGLALFLLLASVVLPSCEKAPVQPPETTPKEKGTAAARPDEEAQASASTSTLWSTSASSTGRTIEGTGQVTVFSYCYDRGKAIKYAETYAINANREVYIEYPEDCTNFVSQCLLWGGWPMKEPPLYYFASPDKIKEWIEKDPNLWFYYDEDDCSHTWAVANDLFELMKRSERVDRMIELSPNGEVWQTQLKEGDIVQIDYYGDGHIEHSMVITDAKGDIKVSYHSPTGNQFNLSLEEIMLNEIEEAQKEGQPEPKFYGWLLKDYFNN